MRGGTTKKGYRAVERQLNDGQIQLLAQEFKMKGLSVVAIATTLGISRSRFYSRKPKQKQSVNSSHSQRPTEQEIRNALRNLDHRYYLYGYRRLCALFRQQFGWVINHKRMRRILASMKWKTKRISRTKHQYKRIEKPSQPNQVG